MEGKAQRDGRKGQMSKKGNKLKVRALALLLALAVVMVSCPLTVGAETVGRTTAYVNLRTGAGTGNRIIETVSLGTQLTITDTSNAGWYKVTVPSGKSGYMCSDYIQITGNTGTATGGATYTGRDRKSVV